YDASIPPPPLMPPQLQGALRKRKASVEDVIGKTILFYLACDTPSPM
ncbi:jg23324, partial [Pararge aegeria aegeria]